MESIILLFLSVSAVAAVIGSPINIFKSRGHAQRGEIIILNDLDRTTFRRH